MGKDFRTLAARWRVPMGFMLSLVFLIFAQPTYPLLGIGGSVALLGLGIRAYASGYLEKNRRLATFGPYAYTRNPLYLGSFLLGLGLVISGGVWWLGLVFLSFFLVVYGPVMRREEAWLRQLYGPKYEAYAAAVPLFLPRRKPPRVFGEKFEWGRYRKNREYEAALGLLAGIVFLFLKILLR